MTQGLGPVWMTNIFPRFQHTKQEIVSTGLAKVGGDTLENCLLSYIDRIQLILFFCRKSILAPLTRTDSKPTLILLTLSELCIVT